MPIKPPDAPQKPRAELGGGGGVKLAHWIIRIQTDKNSQFLWCKVEFNIQASTDLSNENIIQLKGKNTESGEFKNGASVI